MCVKDDGKSTVKGSSWFFEDMILCVEDKPVY